MMLVWFAETTLIATVLAAAILLAGRWLRLGPVARHALWLVVLIKLVAPPLVSWPRPAWPRHWSKATVAPVGPGPALDEVRRSPLREARSESPARPEPTPSPATARAAATATAAIDFPLIGRAALGAWAIASAFLGLWNIGRVARFHRRLRLAVPAPGRLVEEARRIGRRMGVRAPEILIVPEPATPMLWFLGRPKLLLPAGMLETLEADGRRGILAHELAHVLRRDHWVHRLELVAGLLWWWNPLYWLTCRRINAEAELACDEQAVRAFPEGRLAYAEALLEVCRSLSMTNPPSPALGVAGDGRFLERRVTMILSGQSPSRASVPVLMGAGLLALLALPGWNASGSSARTLDETIASAPIRSSAVDVSSPDDDENANDDDDDKMDVKVAAGVKADDDDEKADVDADDREADDEGDADDDEKGAGHVKREKPSRDDDEGDDEADDEKAADREKREKPSRTVRKRTTESRSRSDSKTEEDLEAMGEKLAKDLEEKLGPGLEFQKRMEELDPKIEKEMKALEKELKGKFGPGSDFEKSMKEKFGPGSDFEKSMKEKFGPGSDFEKDMKKKFGPGSDFEKDMKKKFGPGSDFEKNMKKNLSSDAKAGKGRKKSGDSSADANPDRKKKAAPGGPKEEQRAKARQIKELQSQIDRLTEQLKALQDQESDGVKP